MLTETCRRPLPAVSTPYSPPEPSRHHRKSLTRGARHSAVGILTRRNLNLPEARLTELTSARSQTDIQKLAIPLVPIHSWVSGRAAGTSPPSLKLLKASKTHHRLLTDEPVGALWDAGPS